MKVRDPETKWAYAVNAASRERRVLDSPSALARRKSISTSTSTITPDRSPRPNPLRTDPTRTGLLRRALMAEMRRRFARLRADLHDLIVKEDVFGLKPPPSTFAGLVEHPRTQSFLPIEPTANGNNPLTSNTRWKLFSLAEKVRAFRDWLRTRLGDMANDLTRVWQDFTERAYRRGVERSYDDAKGLSRSSQIGGLGRGKGGGPIDPGFLAGALTNRPASSPFLTPTTAPTSAPPLLPSVPLSVPLPGRANEAKTLFTQSVLRRPEAAESVNLLASRADEGFQAVTEAVERNSLRTLSDLLLRGDADTAEVSTALGEVIQGVGTNRALAVAHDAVVRPHADGQLAALAELGYGDVEAQVEYRTTGGKLSKKGNPSPCPICRPYAGVVMTVSQAKGLIPRHPHCLCSWRPVLSPTGNVFCPTGKGGGADPTCSLGDKRGRPTAAEMAALETVDNFNPRQARDRIGRFAAGAAGAAGSLVQTGGHLEHAAKEFVRDKLGKALEKLPAPVRAAVEASYYATRTGTKAAFVTWTTGQALAERVAKERGLSESQAHLLRSTLAKVDLVAMKPISVALGATGVGAAALGGASLIPPATAGYLAYSTARDPLATIRAARGMIRDALQKVSGKPERRPPPSFRPTVEQLGNRREDRKDKGEERSSQAKTNARRLADLLAQHDYSDWFNALFSVALDETGDVEKAAQLASRLYRQHPNMENVFCPTGKGGGIDPGCGKEGKRVGGTRATTPSELAPPPPPPVLPQPAPAQSSLTPKQQDYADDAKNTANARFVRNRVERIKAKLESEDKFWEPVREKIVKLEARLERLSKAHDKEADKLGKMLEEEIDNRKNGRPRKYTREELRVQGEKESTALDKYLKMRRTLADEAWKEIGKHVRSEENQNRNGVYGEKPVLKKVSFTLNTSKDPGRDPSPAQQTAVREVEQRLKNVLSTRLEGRIAFTDIRSIKDGEEQRAFFRGTRHGGDGQSIYITRNTSPDTVAHELGHSLETNANIHAAAQGFLYLRVGQESAKPMGAGYKDWEMGRDNDFGKAFGDQARYVGKHYKTDDTEVTSMGLEKLYADPIRFAKDDPQYFKFMLGVLDGTFTK